VRILRIDFYISPKYNRANKLGESYLNYKGGITFKNVNLYCMLREVFNLWTSKLTNFVTYELLKFYVSELPKWEKYQIIGWNNKNHSKKKPPKPGRKPIATAATGRWNVLMIPFIKSFCQAFLKSANKNREVYYDSKKTR
jgi:hypothetical protein